MKIYTKVGDAGETVLIGGGKKVPKDTLRVRSYGGIDELNAVLGMALASGGVPDELHARLLRIQSELFQLGAELATPMGAKVPTALIDADAVARLEAEIDEMDGKLPALRNFILPGGSPAGAVLHLCRTVCRRAERDIVTLHRGESQRPELLKYVNRMSDYLFVAARFANHSAKITEAPWIAPPAPSAPAAEPSS